MKPTTQSALLVGLMSSVALLAACDKTDSSLGQKVDSAVASTQQAATAAQAEVKKEVNDTVKEIKASASDTSQAVSAKTADGVITAKVNAELVKDPSLSALKINVDTTDASVALTGSAPSESARERATSLARAVDGVKQVDNRLVVEVKK